MGGVGLSEVVYDAPENPVDVLVDDGGFLVVKVTDEFVANVYAHVIFPSIKEGLMFTYPCL